MGTSETKIPVKPWPTAECSLKNIDWDSVFEHERRYIDYLNMVDFKVTSPPTIDVDSEIDRMLNALNIERPQRDLTYRADLIVCASDSPSCNQTEVDFQWKVLKCRQGRVDMDIGDIDWNRYDFMGIATTFPNKKPQYCYSLRKLGETEF